MTKRGNTGTSGIAYPVSIAALAYGFSSVMTSSTTNINSYSWNLDVVSHELVTTLLQPHALRMARRSNRRLLPQGGCTNGPQVNTGTIMSYCHLDNSTKRCAVSSIG